MKGIQVLYWDHDVTLKNVEEFRMTIWKFMDSEKRKFILDLSGVTYLNSAALGVIADAVLLAGRNFKQLVIASVQPTVEEIFKIVRFGTFMNIFDELGQAVDYYSQVKE